MINVKKTKKEFLSLLLDSRVRTVLDLGFGKGLMSKFLYKKDRKIIGIDFKEDHEDLNNFTFIKGDLLKESFGEENDLVISSLILHFFKTEKALETIDRMKIATSRFGYNLLICLSNKDVFAKKNKDKFYPSFGELKKLYSGWKIIKELNGITEVENHGNLGQHQHDLIFLLVQKS